MRKDHNIAEKAFIASSLKCLWEDFFIDFSEEKSCHFRKTLPCYLVSRKTQLAGYFFPTKMFSVVTSFPNKEYQVNTDSGNWNRCKVKCLSELWKNVFEEVDRSECGVKRKDIESGMSTPIQTLPPRMSPSHYLHIDDCLQYYHMKRIFLCEHMKVTFLKGSLF